MDLDIDKLLAEAVSQRASDLHIQVGESPDMRVDGDLTKLGKEYPLLDEEAVGKLLLPILTDEQREKFQRDWELDFSYAIADIGRFRVNYHYQQKTIAAAFRHIPNKIPTLADIQAPMALLDFARLERGLILITGPTGSGKSTTLAAIIDVINNEKPCNIITLEDPIEFVHSRKRALIKQREIGRDTHSFAEGLRRGLRQDPDVILVGEMRDPETCSVALASAETGHLVLSTLHTRSAPSSVDRIIDQFPSEQQNQIRVQLAGALKGIVSQTLLPRADGEGRVAAHEVLVVDSAVENIIRRSNSAHLRTPLQTHAEIGMQTMGKALVWLVQQGIVDYDVARRRSMELHEFDQLIEAYNQGVKVQIPRLVTPHDLAQGQSHSSGMRPQSGFAQILSVGPEDELCPIHQLPLGTPMLFSEQTGERYPEGTTHRLCLGPAGAALRPIPASGVDLVEELPAPRPMRPHTQEAEETVEAEEPAETDEQLLTPPTFKPSSGDEGQSPHSRPGPSLRPKE